MTNLKRSSKALSLDTLAVHAGTDARDADSPVVSPLYQSVNFIQEFGTAERNGVQLRFEASVCAAIPVVKVLRESMIVTTVHRIDGIVNGTTNFILTRMVQSGATPGGPNSCTAARCTALLFSSDAVVYRNGWFER